MSYPQTRARWKAYGVAVTVTAATLALRLLLAQSITADHPLLILFVIPILVSAYVGGVGPGLLSTALIALGTDLFPFSPGKRPCVHPSAESRGMAHPARYGGAR